MRKEPNTVTVIRELATNGYRIRKIAAYEFQMDNRSTRLGFLWSVLSPALQICIYWFVFGLGLRSGTQKGNVPYLWWLVSGIIPWLYVNRSITGGATSITRMLSVTSRIKFPFSILPAAKMLSLLWDHLIAMGLVLVFLGSFGYLTWPTFLWFPYYAVCTLLFSFSLSLTTSALTVISRDVAKALPYITRIIFYLSPVLWSMDKVDPSLYEVLKCTPVYYIINGYRNCLIYGESATQYGFYAAVFWGETLLLFLIGCVVHMRTRHLFTET